MKKIARMIAVTAILGIGCQIPNVEALVPTSNNFIVAQYFGIWGSSKSEPWEKKFRKDTPFKHLNRIYIGFGSPVKTQDGSYTIKIDGDENRVKALIKAVKKVNPTADIFIFVGGNNSNFGKAAFDPQFVDNVIQFMTEYGFNGFDIDWEVGLEKYNLSHLIASLHNKFELYGYKLTLDVWPFVDSAYDMLVLKQNLDQINIMSYGTGLNLANCVDEYVKAGFPANKIIGGIETEIDYHQFGGKVDSLGENGTIGQKVNYAIDHGLAGITEWRLDNDYVMKDNPGYPTYQGAETLWKFFQSGKFELE